MPGNFEVSSNMENFCYHAKQRDRCNNLRTKNFKRSDTDDLSRQDQPNCEKNGKQIGQEILQKIVQIYKSPKINLFSIQTLIEVSKDPNLVENSTPLSFEINSTAWFQAANHILANSSKADKIKFKAQFNDLKIIIDEIAQLVIDKLPFFSRLKNILSVITNICRSSNITLGEETKKFVCKTIEKNQNNLHELDAGDILSSFSGYDFYNVKLLNRCIQILGGLDNLNESLNQALVRQCLCAIRKNCTSIFPETAEFLTTVLLDTKPKKLLCLAYIFESAHYLQAKGIFSNEEISLLQQKFKDYFSDINITEVDTAAKLCHFWSKLYPVDLKQLENCYNQLSKNYASLSLESKLVIYMLEYLCLNRISNQSIAFLNLLSQKDASDLNKIKALNRIDLLTCLADQCMPNQQVFKDLLNSLDLDEVIQDKSQLTKLSNSLATAFCVTKDNFYKERAQAVIEFFFDCVKAGKYIYNSFSLRNDLDRLIRSCYAIFPPEEVITKYNLVNFYQTWSEKADAEHAAMVSYFENEVGHILNSFYPEFLPNQTIGLTIKPDFVSESNKVVIECDGDLYHTFENQSGKRIPLGSTILRNQIIGNLGYQLITITYSKWNACRDYTSKVALIHYKISKLIAQN